MYMACHSFVHGLSLVRMALLGLANRSVGAYSAMPSGFAGEINDIDDDETQEKLNAWRLKDMCRHVCRHAPRHICA